MRQQALCNSIYTWTQDKRQHTQWSEKSLQSTAGQQQPLQGFNSRRPRQLAPTTMEDPLQWTFQQRAKEKEGEAKETKDTKESNKAKDTKEQEKDIYCYKNSYGKSKGQAKGKQAWEPAKGADKGQGKNKGANNQGKGKNPMAVCYRCGQPGHLAEDRRTTVYDFVGHSIWATTWQHGAVVLFKQRLWCQLVWQPPNRLLPSQWATIPAASTIHQNLRRQHHNPQQRRNNRRQQYILWQQWTTRCHQHQWHRHYSQSNRKRTKSKSWLTVEQRRMSAHHGLHPTHPCTHSNMGRCRNWEQQPMKLFQCMDTSWWPTSTSNNWLFFVCEMTQPIMSVTKLAEQGFNIQLNETPAVTHTHKGIQLSTGSTWWTLLHDDGVCQHSSEHAAGSTSNDPRQNSKDHTSHLDTNRYRGPEEQKWPLDIQQPVIPGESAQNTTQSTLHARPTVSSSNRQVGEL